MDSNNNSTKNDNVNENTIVATGTATATTTPTGIITVDTTDRVNSSSTDSRPHNHGSIGRSSSTSLVLEDDSTERNTNNDDGDDDPRSFEKMTIPLPPPNPTFLPIDATSKQYSIDDDDDDDADKNYDDNVVGGGDVSDTVQRSPSKKATLDPSTVIITTPPSTYGPMQSVVLLLRNYGIYGLSERVVYHFNALQQQQQPSVTDNSIPISVNEASSGSIHATSSSSSLSVATTKQKQLFHSLASIQQTSSSFENQNEDFIQSSNSQYQHQQYGIIRLLECVPTKPWQKLSRRQKRDFKSYIRQFNDQTRVATTTATRSDQMAVKNSDNDDIDPDATTTTRVLPFILNPETRFYSTYEMTRIAYIIDASYTMTCTYQESNQNFGCPMDRFIHMSTTFLTSLVQPITITQTYTYQPQYAITVLAVYPSAENATKQTKCTSVLVRDYHVSDVSHAKVLCQKIHEFCSIEVESEIAYRMMPAASSMNGVNGNQNSIFNHMLDAGYVALSSLSDAGRPIIVIGTDCCSVQCRDISRDNLLHDDHHYDVPIIILDASSPIKRTSTTTNRSDVDSTNNYVDASISMMNYDPHGASFPFHLTDDSEAIYRIAMLSGGSFWDEEMIRTGAATFAGQVDPHSFFSQDYYFAYKHSIQPNAIQWYTLFTLSSLSPRIHDTWGKLPPPSYLSSSLSFPSNDWSGGSIMSPSQNDFSIRRFSMSTQHETTLLPQKITQSTLTTFSNYIVNPIPIHEIILMRVKEGYRVKQFGQSTNDNDRISILFVVPLHMDLTLRYELSFKPLSLENSTGLIGVAHIKIELEGDSDFVALIKNEYLSNQGASKDRQLGLTSIVLQETSTRICTYLRGIRREDLLQSYLSPVKWTDQLSSPTTPFIRRLGTLTTHQRRSHFARTEFDCICIGHMPWNDDDFLSEFRDNDDGSEQLADVIKTWSTQVIVDGRIFIKRTNQYCGVAGYVIVSIVPSPLAHRLFTVVFETFNSISVQSRLTILTSIRNAIKCIRTVQLLPKQLCKHLVATNHHRNRLQQEQIFSQNVLTSLQNHTSWDLVKDPELTPLLIKRRVEIGKFVMLESSDHFASFAKLFDSETTSKTLFDPGNLSQYRFVVLDDKVVVNLFMECESGRFFPFRNRRQQLNDSTTFNRLVKALKKRDQECGHALRCRTTLLQAFSVPAARSSPENDPGPYALSIEKLIDYSSKVSTRLRFFHDGVKESNDILHEMTRKSILSHAFGPKVAELPISSSAKFMDSIGSGSWFVVEYDKYTCSILHLSRENKIIQSPDDGLSASFRELLFFTFGTSDLYNRRDDVEDDLVDDDHISEHLQVTEFCESLQAVHDLNFTYAAYLSLLRQETTINKCFNSTDVSEIMKTLDFVQVGQVTIDEGHPVIQRNNSSKFLKMYDSILHPFPGDDRCFFYRSNDYCDEITPSDDDSADLHNNNVHTENVDAEIRSVTSQKTGEPKLVVTDIAVADDVSEFGTALDVLTLPAPVFVRFAVNGTPASMLDLGQIKSQSIVSIFISIFKERGSRQDFSKGGDLGSLPTTHIKASSVLSFLLNAYVAEQILERLCSKGSKLDDSDIGQAKLCVRNARNALMCKLDVLFYSRNSDKMVKASDSSTAAEVDETFDFLTIELQKSTTVTFKDSGPAGFLLDCLDEESNELKYWCFLKIHRTLGLISVDIYHPRGLEEANDLMQVVIDKITACCHRVNQLLLLLNLNNTRISSRLLIPDTNTSQPEYAAIDTQEIDSRFPDGHFECSIVYRTSFNLFYRFAGNPQIMVRSLEAYVLHNLAVSNRPEVFVYKDESGSIFYMKLVVEEVQQDAIVDTAGDAPKSIVLFVYGIDVPDSSITEQLRRLLHKHLLTKAVERVSTVLTKNPRYHWRQPDIKFIKSFPTQSSIDDEFNSIADEVKIRTYAFPTATYDPGMVALFFRQNLCGSTFIHPLITSEWESAILQAESTISDDSVLHFQPTDLVFYYNTSSSDLDPNLQSESTLTAKGAQYSAQTGVGLAIIEVSLLTGDGRPVQAIKAAIPSQHNDCSFDNSSFQSLTFKTVSNEIIDSKSNDKAAFVRVQIADTDLKTDILHEWILLSLNQALVAWNVERQLEKIQIQVASPTELTELKENRIELESSVGTASSGLSTLADILEFAQKLPDPTARLTECNNVVRSSIVASFAMDLLEKVVIDQLEIVTKNKILQDKHYILEVIHSSRSSNPKKVKLERKPDGRVVARRLTGQTFLNDSSIDCPEYTIFFCSPEYSRVNELNQIVTYPKLFKDVAVGYETTGEKGDFAKSLFEFKRRHRPFFRRSMAFILKVKRNRRSLLAYNWSASLFKQVEKRLADMESMFLHSTIQSVQLLNFRSLNMLAPVPTIRVANSTSSKDYAANSTTRKKEPTELERLPMTRQSTLPPTIRRPKLVGKSIEGSALQAVAKSRARASVSRFKAIPQSSTPVTHRKSSSADVLSASKNLMHNKPISSTASNANVVTEEQKRQTADANIVHNQLQKDSYWTNRRQSTMLLGTCQHLVNIHWPLKRSKTISYFLLESIFAFGSVSWVDLSVMLPFRKSGAQSFLNSLGETIVTFYPGLSIINVGQSCTDDILWIMGKVRSLKSCRSFVAIKISCLSRIEENISEVHLEGRLLTLPRRATTDKKSLATLENTAAGLDKLAYNVRNCIGLKGLLLDNCGHHIERSLKSSSTSQGYDDTVSILRPLINMFPLQNVMKTIHSNYKVYKANIILASYNDNLISSFSGKEIYDWLSKNIISTKLVNCGASGLCFKKVVSVDTTQSIVLLSYDDNVPGSMSLDILCRTQGKDLYGFMFREGSNVAVSIFGNIAIEAAILAYVEIKAAAINLRRDHLWNLFLTFREGSSSSLLEMLNLCTIVPFSEAANNSEEFHRLLSLCNDSTLFDPSRFCVRMGNDTVFLRTWESINTDCENNTKQHLYYIPNDDYYLLVSINVNGVQLQLELIDRRRNIANDKRINVVAQKIVNFILFFIWNETANI